MLVECFRCKKEYLTEADPHGFVLEKVDGVLDWRHNCGCFWAQELAALRAFKKEALEVLQKAVNMDCPFCAKQVRAFLARHKGDAHE